jgi:hypothetical protein
LRRRLYDAFNFAFAAWCADPHHHFDRTCQPLLIAALMTLAEIKQVGKFDDWSLVR